MTTSLISGGTANSVVRIQPSDPTTRPLDGPAVGVASRPPWRAAMERPLASIRTTDCAIVRTAV